MRESGGRQVKPRSPRCRATPFGRILMSESLSSAATSIALTTVPLMAITELNFGAMEVAMLAAAGSAAPLLFGLSAGALADRLNKHRLVIACGATRLLLMLTLAIASYFDRTNIALLCAASFGLSTVKLMFDSVAVSLIPQIVKHDELPAANGWMEAANSIAFAIGPGIAGWLMLSSPAAAAFVVCCVLYAMSTTLLSGMQLPCAVQQEGDGNSHLHDIADGIRVLWRNRVQRAIALSAGLFNLFHSGFFAVLAIYLIKDLSLAPNIFGSTLSCVALVGLLAALAGPRLITKLDIRLTLVGSLLLIGPLGLPILYAADVAFPYQVVVVGLSLAAWDFLIVLHVIVEQTIRQTTVSQSHLGRVSATTRFISWGADPIGALAGGALAASLGTGSALTICLIGFTGSGATLLLSKDIRRLGNGLYAL
jgi:MFS family permease